MKRNSSWNYDLSSFWLTRNQSLVYQTWLQEWSKAASALARACWIHRVLTHNILQELISLGLATCVMQKNVGIYTMVPPAVLHHRLLEKAEAFHSLLPHLNNLIKNSSQEFKIQAYKWTEWLKTLYTILLSSSTDFKAFLGIDHIEPEFRSYLVDVYLPKRIAKWIKSRTIVSDTVRNKTFADKKKVPLTEVLIIPDTSFNLANEIVLFDWDKILIASMSDTEMSGILIQSPKLHFTMEHIFELIRKMYDSPKQAL